jgi:hypothetical protein
MTRSDCAHHTTFIAQCLSSRTRALGTRRSEPVGAMMAIVAEASEGRRTQAFPGTVGDCFLSRARVLRFHGAGHHLPRLNSLLPTFVCRHIEPTVASSREVWRCPPSLVMRGAPRLGVSLLSDARDSAGELGTTSPLNGGWSARLGSRIPSLAGTSTTPHRRCPMRHPRPGGRLSAIRRLWGGAWAWAFKAPHLRASLRPCVIIAIAGGFDFRLRRGGE